MSINEKAPTAGKQNESSPNTTSDDTSSNSETGKGKPFDWVSRFELTQEEVNEFTDPIWIIPNLIISSHLILIAAEPNAGKTTVFSQLAGEMAKEGKEVLYINSDISGSDVKKAYSQSKAMGYSLLLPDFKFGESIESIGRELESLSKDSVNLNGIVLIVDTLKKLIDVQNKAQIKELMKIFRRLTARGMTVILLAHTNKYKDDDGNPIFEGTGDLRADVDELIYLIPHRNDDGSMLVTTKPDKVRGRFEELTFNISPEREVTLIEDSQRAQEQLRIKQELSVDAVAIDAIRAALESGGLNKTELVNVCKNSGVSIRRANKVIPKYDNGQSNLPVLWVKSKGKGKTYIYSLKT